MIAYIPFPNNVAFPVNFYDAVIQQTFVGNTFVVYVFMAQNQGVTTIYFTFHTRNIVTYWVTFTLIVMVLTSQPVFFCFAIFNVFFFVEAPYYITIPVNLSYVCLVLITVFCFTNTQRTHDVAAWQHFVRKALEVFPVTNYVTVHVNQCCTFVKFVEQSVTVPAFFRFVDSNTGRENTWNCHKNLSF